MTFLVPKPSVTNVSSTGGGSGNAGSLAGNFISVTPLSAHKVVAVSPVGVVYADKDTVAEQDRILGLTLNSASASGEEVSYLISGILKDSSFSFALGPIYLGSAGALTQVKPTSGMLIQVALALAPDTIQFDIQLNVRLA